MQAQSKFSILFLAALTVAPAFVHAQPSFPPGQLDQLVARIALYPDPLLAQVLAGATFSDQIPDAAGWADQHHYLTGQGLAAAIQSDQLPWDPSVQALLPFPSVLDMMASDMNWTRQLGDAFLAQEQDVMDSVQRQRALSQRYGYLRSNGQVLVGGGGGYITIMPVNPAFVVVPAYDPGIVFFAPRAGFAVGGAIRFGFGVSIGTYFRPWGWGGDRFDWGARRVYINNNVWNRTYVNRGNYVHPYEGIRRPAPQAVRPVEQHRMETRSPQERAAPQHGERLPKESHGKEHR